MPLPVLPVRLVPWWSRLSEGKWGASIEQAVNPEHSAVVRENI